MPPEARYIWITYEDAQRLKQYFEASKTRAPREAQPFIDRMLKELRLVRDIDYDPMPGFQMQVSPKDYESLEDIMSIAGIS